MAVYFIRRKDDPRGLIKIGFTRNVSARVSTLATATPGGIEILASCEGGASVEHELHRELSDFRVAGEWFTPSPAVMAAVAVAQASPTAFRDGGGAERGSLHLVRPEDEHSEDIKKETRFYLNELVKREWRGAGDSPDEARTRVSDRLGLPKEKVRRIWYAMIRSIDGDTYRVLSNDYARIMKIEGKATPRHEFWLAMARRTERAEVA